MTLSYRYPGMDRIDRCGMPIGTGRSCMRYGTHSGGCLPEPQRTPRTLRNAA